ncbi:putative Phosphomannomutase [Glarea lozoyensis 74030]|uniref:Phosphomannomutase n=1 Tax=Glarea lozoyensis (strain ATCC 74030 / MF5533) TaxID=1104152 RepID=H0EYS0_GLAL7|nr:putative Phosphomannomutase [Glarea lozoyensis 74030]
MAAYPPLAERPIKNTIVLFDVDETLTPARRQLRQKVAIGYVGGSDLAKQQEQLGTAEISVTSLFDYCFPENGLTAREDKYKELVKFVLHYIADLDIPVKRGTFMEFRNGMVNISPIGRNASVTERNAYNEYDLEHKVREKMVAALREKFPEFGLTY